MNYEYMIRKTIFLIALASCAFAQAPGEPFPMIRVLRTAGPAPKYDLIRPYADAKTSVNVFGLGSISGPSETWLIEAHDSFESLEAVDTALAYNAPGGTAILDSLPLSASTIALYRPGLSYRPEEAIRSLPKARYVNVSMYRIRAGAEDDFATLIAQRRRALDSVNLDRPEIAYQVVSGAPSGTYIFLSPLATLKQLDNAVHAPAHMEGATQIELIRERMLFRMEPRFSYVSDAFAAESVEFWRGK